MDHRKAIEYLKAELRKVNQAIEGFERIADAVFEKPRRKALERAGLATPGDRTRTGKSPEPDEQRLPPSETR